MSQIMSNIQTRITPACEWVKQQMPENMPSLQTVAKIGLPVITGLGLLTAGIRYRTQIRNYAQSKVENAILWWFTKPKSTQPSAPPAK